MQLIFTKQKNHAANNFPRFKQITEAFGSTGMKEITINLIESVPLINNTARLASFIYRLSRLTSCSNNYSMHAASTFTKSFVECVVITPSNASYSTLLTAQ